MKEEQVKLPSPDHPISIQRKSARVVVSVAAAFRSSQNSSQSFSA